MNYREKMPMYAEDSSVWVTGDQLRKILRGRNPFKGDVGRYNNISGRGAYRVTQLKDGSWWVENYRFGAPLFAPDYWWKLPKTAGPRIRKLQEFVESL